MPIPRLALTGLAAAVILVAGCAQDATLPPVSAEEFPEPEATKDWEDWGEDRQDRAPTRRAEIVGDLLGNDDIRRALSGQTLRGCYPDGTRFVERLADDGRFYLVGDTEAYQGRWSVDEERLCFDYEVGPQADGPPVCFPVSRQGGELYFYAEDFSRIVAATICPSQG